MSFCRGRSYNTFINPRFLFSLVLTSTALITSAQSSLPVLTNADSAEVWFDRIVGLKNIAIVNGPEYHISFNGRKTHPFYKSAESDRSFVRYDNNLYPNLDLLYDTYGDILVLKWPTPAGLFFIKLDKNLVQSFDLYHHQFKKFNYGGAPGYFDVLFEEKQFAVLVRRYKTERIEKRIRDYEENDVAYLLDHGKWIRITGKGSFNKTIKKDQRKALNTFIKDNGIKLRKRRDEDLKKLGAFCYSLKTGG